MLEIIINQLATVESIKELIQKSKFNIAISACERYLSQHKSNVQVWYMLADLFLRTKQPQAALQAINSAGHLAPNQPQIIIFKINCLIQLGDINSALSIAEQLLASKCKLLAKDWLKLGVHFHQLNSLSSAHQCFIHAVNLDPKNSHFRFNLATSFRNIGDIKHASKELAKTLSLNPNDWDAHLAQSLLKKVTIDDNCIEHLKHKLTQNVPQDARSKLLFALAKEQEDCQLFTESFQSLEQANALRNQFTQYNVNHDVEAMLAIQATYGQLKQTTEYGPKHIQPIFIVGLPRTGSTLLERIISQHPQVLAAGELQNFSACLTKATINHSNIVIKNKMDFIKRSADINFTHLGLDYLNSVKTMLDSKTIFIDKMPFNFLYIALILKALPHAKIIHLARTPMAACYAIYKTNFDQAYPFSYEQTNLAKYYIGYRRLMSHWQQITTTNMLEINYEQLVTTPEAEAKKTFKFLGLDWDNDYLNLDKNKQATATASSSQIRGEIYQSSIELWRKYRQFLHPIESELIKAGIDPETW